MNLALVSLSGIVEVSFYHYEMMINIYGESWSDVLYVEPMHSHDPLIQRVRLDRMLQTTPDLMIIAIGYIHAFYHKGYKLF